ncbi:MAG: putative metal-dependent hydrolase YfiT [Planctomycetota bacterium]
MGASAAIPGPTAGIGGNGQPAGMVRGSPTSIVQCRAMDPVEAAITSYEAGRGRLRAACAGLSSESLRRRIGPGEWSVLENAVHLLDSDLASTHRMRRIVAEDCPLLVAYDENAFIARLASEGADLDEVLDLFDANRRFTARWLRTLPADAFARTGVHTQRGKVTLLEIVEIYAHHVDHHLAFVAEKRRNLGA